MIDIIYLYVPYVFIMVADRYHQSSKFTYIYLWLWTVSTLLVIVIDFVDFSKAMWHVALFWNSDSLCSRKRAFAYGLYHIKISSRIMLIFGTIMQRPLPAFWCLLLLVFQKGLRKTFRDVLFELWCCLVKRESQIKNIYSYKLSLIISYNVIA